MNRTSIIETDAAATRRVCPEHSETYVEHRRFAARLQDFPDVVKFLIAGIEPLVGRMKFKADDLWISHQLFGIAGDSRQIGRMDIQRRQHAAKRLGMVGNELDGMLIGIARAL